MAIPMCNHFGHQLFIVSKYQSGQIKPITQVAGKLSGVIGHKIIIWQRCGSPQQSQVTDSQPGHWPDYHSQLKSAVMNKVIMNHWQHLWGIWNPFFGLQISNPFIYNETVCTNHQWMNHNVKNLRWNGSQEAYVKLTGTEIWISWHYSRLHTVA